MGRLPMPEKKVEEIKSLSQTMNNTQIAQELGISRRTISRIVRGPAKENKKDYVKCFSDLRRREARQIMKGCLNVYDKVDWLVG